MGGVLIGNRRIFMLRLLGSLYGMEKTACLVVRTNPISCARAPFFSEYSRVITRQARLLFFIVGTVNLATKLRDTLLF